MIVIQNRLSVVVPCYNSEKNIERVIEGAEIIFEKNNIKDYEFILVNDCSRDNTFSVISKLAEEKSYVTAIDLAKNAGQHGALMAGFHYVTGEYVITCEDDGQTQISAVGEMLEKIGQGYDVVAAKYEQRPETSLMRRFGRYMGKKMAMTMLPRPEGVSVPIFFLAKRFIIDEIIRYDHPYPYITGLLLRTTHNIANVEVNQRERISGGSGYTFRKLLNLWMNGFTTFSVKPLRIAMFFGIASSAMGIIYALLIILRRIFLDDVIMGWSSLSSIILIMSGIILCVLGMIGEYVGRIYICINNTPQYVIRYVITQLPLTDQETKLNDDLKERECIQNINKLRGGEL